MKPIDFRNTTFRDLQRQVISLRLSVWEALAQHGPCTTRELSRECGLDILTVRPRVTELLQLGFVVCTNDGQGGHEGIYQALTTAEAETLFTARQAEAREQQMSLGL